MARPIAPANATYAPHTRPEFGTSDYWRAYADGLITEAQKEADQAAHDLQQELHASRKERSRRGRSHQLNGLAAAARGRQPKSDLPPPKIHSAWCSLGDHIIEDRRTVPADHRILAKLLQIGKTSRYVETSAGGLAEMLGYSREWIRQRLIRLGELGYIAGRTLKLLKRNGRSWFAGQIIELAPLAFPGGKLPRPDGADQTWQALIESNRRRLRHVLVALNQASFRRFDPYNSSCDFKTTPSESHNFSPWKAEKVPRTEVPF